MRLLGESVYVRYMEILKTKLELPDGGYEGLYIKDIANQIYKKYGDQLKNNKEDNIFRTTAENFILKI